MSSRPAAAFWRKTAWPALRLVFDTAMLLKSGISEVRACLGSVASLRFRAMKLNGPWTLTVFLILALARSSTIGAETNHNFARWEKEIAAFEQMDRTNPPPKGAVLFIGSSTIRLWKTLAGDFPNHQVINRGFGGSQIVDATHFAERIIFPYEPKVIFLRAGGNDLWAGKSPEQVFAEFKAFVTKVHAKLPETEIVFIALCPSVARWARAEQEKTLNTLVREFARRTPRVSCTEGDAMSLGADGKPRPELFVSDMLHFNAAGYKLLAEVVRPYLPK